MRFLRPLISVAILALIVFLLYQYVLWPFFFQNKAKIVHMIDPDSYIVMQDGKLHNVQLIGVDAPEVTKLDGKTIRQCFSGEAKDLAASTFFRGNREIILEADEGSGETDIYGRELKYVYLADGTLLNESLIKDGLARVYYDNEHEYAKKTDFEIVQEEAKQEQKGLWSVCGKN